MQSIQTKLTQNHKTTAIKGIAKRITVKHSDWVCSCGHSFPKKGTEMSGYASGSRGLHVHYPRCGKVVDQFINPK